jgi:hypothetical protein
VPARSVAGAASPCRSSRRATTCAQVNTVTGSPCRRTP